VGISPNAPRGYGSSRNHKQQHHKILAKLLTAQHCVGFSKTNNRTTILTQSFDWRCGICALELWWLYITMVGKV